MHDPLTVAFDIPRPWPEWDKTLGWHWPAMITIWHHDPEKGGDEDSCDYLGFNMNKTTGWWPGEVEHLKDMPPEAQAAIHFIWWKFNRKLTTRKWWQHPRFHIWHWDVQIHFLLHLKRYLFSRCAKCGGRFSWKEATHGQVIGTWGGAGPAWFKNAEKIWHFKCDAAHVPTAAFDKTRAEADKPTVHA